MSKTRRRLRRAVILSLEVVAGLTLVFLLLMGGLVWRLSEGPIEVEFLTEFIEEALSDPDAGLRVDVATTQLTWEGWQRGIDIRLLDVTAYDADGTPISDVDTMTVSFDLRALVRGELAPTELQIVAPSILLTFAEDGTISIGHSAGAADAPLPDEAGIAEVNPDSPQDEAALFGMILDELSRPPDEARQLGNLRAFEVRNASLQVRDELHDTTWTTTGANLILRRDVSGANLEAGFAVRLEHDATFFSVSANFDRDAESFRLDVGFDRIRPSLLADQLPYLADFAEFDRPVGGEVNATFRADTLDLAMRLDVTFDDSIGSVSASGSYTLGSDSVIVDAAMTDVALDALADLPWLAPLAGFDVTVDGEAQLVIAPDGVQSAGFVFRSGAGSVALPDQLDRPLDVVSIELEGAMAGAGAALDIARADIAFVDAHFEGSATAFGGEDGYEISLQGSLADLGIDEIDQYWPVGVSTNARNWVKQRVLAGNFDRIGIDLYGVLDTDRYSFSAIDSQLSFAFSDVSLIYVVGMPPLDGMNGTGSFDGQEFRVEIAEGATTFDLTAGPATIVMDSFDDPLPRARVEGTLHGDLRNHFRMIDHEPMSFLSDYSFSPEQASGRGSLSLAIAFDVDDVVPLEAIAISISAQLTGATIPGMVGGDPLTGADLQLTATNSGMHIEGAGLVNGTEIALTRDENFGGGEYAAQSTMRGVFSHGQLAQLGFDLQRWAQGQIGMSARMTEYRDDTARIDAAFDLSAATMSIPPLVWSKPPGTEATAEVSVSLRDGDITTIDRFDLEGGGLSATGRVTFDANGEVQAADLASLTLGRTQIAGRIEAQANGGVAIRIDGGTLDLTPYLEDDGTEDADDGDTSLVAISMALDRLWVTTNGYLSQVSGTTQLVGSTWFTAQIAARTTSGAPVSLTLDPTDTGRFLRVTTDDAGSLLADLDLVDSVRNGRMVVAARFRDGEPGKPLVGDMDVSDFRLVDAPLVAQIIGIAGVTGILDALQGEGIGFGQLATTFRFRDDTIEFREGSMVGPSLGLTFAGMVDIERDLVSLRGAVAPAYALNGILGSIPLVGDVLVGGEGEGIFAVTYEASGAADSPQIAVNPLSALTPGVLRNIFPGG